MAANDTWSIGLLRLRVGFESHDARANRLSEEHDGGGVEKGARGVDSGLEILCRSSVPPNPSEEPLYDPTPRVNDKADLIGILALFAAGK